MSITSTLLIRVCLYWYAKFLKPLRGHIPIGILAATQKVSLDRVHGFIRIKKTQDCPAEEMRWDSQVRTFSGQWNKHSLYRSPPLVGRAEDNLEWYRIIITFSVERQVDSKIYGDEEREHSWFYFICTHLREANQRPQLHFTTRRPTTWGKECLNSMNLHL